MMILPYITAISVILLIGILCSMLSEKFKISNMAVLIIAGILLRLIKYEGKPIIELPTIFIAGVSIIALALIVFDGSSRFKFKELDTFSMRALKLFLLLLLFNLTFLSAFVMWRFKIDIFLALIFSTIMTQTAFDVTSSLIKINHTRVLNLLETESILNTPFIVLLPFLILDLKQNIGTTDIMTKFMGYSLPFLQQIIIGVGAGMLVGLVVFKAMKKRYSEKLSPIALITSALISYILAENLGGNGVLAVTALGLFFGNTYLKQKDMLKEFSLMVSSSLEILVFILIGIIIQFPLQLDFLLKGFVVYLVVLLIRYAAIQVAFSSKFNRKEKIFMTLLSPKGIATATLTLTFSTYAIQGMSTVLNLLLISMVYSIIVSSIAAKFQAKFLEETHPTRVLP